MEAVPRLHMLWFPSKSSPEGTSFAGLKRYIAEFYQENPDNYSKELYALETLRNQALNTPKDNCAILKRYFCQLESLLNRFPKLRDKKVIFQFTWKDLYQNKVHEYNDIGYEQAAVLFNIATAHTQAGASVDRTDVEGMKLACTHFQCAAWAFGEIRERYINMDEFGDCFTTELLVFMQQVSLAQAQECILEKSLIDNRKPNIVAKVTAQIVVYYGAALAALLTGGDDGPVASVVDSAVYKQWKKYVRFKISYLNCILYLYQGQHAEEQRKMGERLTLFEAAWEKLEEARKESKGLPDQKEINESLIFTADVVEGKRKNAKNENEFIYHEPVPELASISAVQGANLVNGISFSVTDPEVAGEDIFARLVPMKAHEASSLYSEEKAKLLRKYGAKIEERDSELASFMSSLTLDNLNINEEKANKIPQGIVDRCAALNANTSAIPELVASMSRLAEICTDVEANLKEISQILAQEDKEEKEFQQLTGVQRTPNAHITELSREFLKYNEAHNRAGESNDTLRKAMELHINNLKILAKPLQEIQQSVPKLSSELNTAEVFKDVKLIVNKVNEMKAQRSQFHADLRIAVNDDDITSKIIAHDSEEDLQGLFERELAKHERLTQLIDQNLLAQDNILKALTESYAKAAPVLKTLADVKHKRESFFASLAASYDVYEDLLAKSAKGLEFYNKLSANVQKLLSRCKSARDVQSEERQQRLKSVNNKPSPSPLPTDTTYSSATVSQTPKLRDYLKAKNAAKEKNMALGNTNNPAAYNLNAAQYIPPVRPNPLGSENPTQAVCSGGTYYPNTASGNTVPPTVGPNEPPPPYSLQQQQYYDPNGAGYTNPMYYQYQQNVAPPAYKPQASPNSQFTNLNVNMANLSLQQSSGGAANSPKMPYSQSPYSNPGAGNANVYNNQNPMNNSIPSTNLQQQNNYNASHAMNNPQMMGMYGGNMNTQQTSLQQQQQYMPGNSVYNTSTATLSQQMPVAYTQAYSSPVTTTGGNATQMYTSPVVTTASTTATQPQYLYGTNTANYQQNPTMPNNNFNNSPAQNNNTNVPPSQPLYVATNQIVPPTIQAPYIVNNQVAGNPTLQQFQPPTGGQLTNQNLPGQNVNPQVNANIPSQQQQQMITPAAAAGGQANTFSNMPIVARNPSNQAAMPMAPNVSGSIAPGQSPYTLPGNAAQTPSSGNANAVPNVVTTTQANSSTSTGGVLRKTSSSTMHPGYSYNPQSGTFDYGSGYHQAAPNNQPFYGQYTTGAQPINSQVGTTDSKSSGKTNLSTGFDAPIVSHTKTSAPVINPEIKPTNESYYNPPYGYQKNNNNTDTITPNPQIPTTNSAIPPAVNTPAAINYAMPQQNYYQQQQSATYIQSGMGTTANTQTTKSVNTYATSSQHTPTTPKPVKTAAPKTSNIDLLSDIDFSGVMAVPPPILPEPALKPVVVNSPPASQVAAETPPTKTTSVTEEVTPEIAYVNSLTTTPMELTSPIDSPAVRKASFDNLSNCSDISSLDNFDWDSTSMRSTTDKHQNLGDKHSIISSSNSATFQMKPIDPFTDDKVLKYFHKEVERFEKLVDSLNVKMLNGHTALSTKWKELQDLLAKDASSRTTTIAKLFPEKNRSLDCLPYDHARVKLDKETDDYINAAYIKNLGSGCPNLIIAQTPQQNTINDFWSMIWSQKARTVLCLHTPNEMLDPFWPQTLDKESHFDDFTVKCVKIIQLSHCVEYQLNLSMLGSDVIIQLAILQIKQWTKSTPSMVVGIARNASQAHQQRCMEFNDPQSPLIMNCLTGSERSELVAVAICAIMATQNKRPVLINVVDVWHRICQQRQQALRDIETLEESLQIVLNHAHDVLNKRGIMTSYQMKIAPQVTAQEKQATKDPLNELDALWKLKT
ncbi:tyrosine-protein phosphatase non-receptor type 23 [Musca vetustissima]|uniref:tyrosine-protein phosphatase non-receptor type 23 n=1 Tax=Musca vetustissima TaxID=27455 RepID=UPI002AB7416B|nr:tyrosine-protein phosphatase non-receptor type 23 [Musca vetustissima]